jgi:hypothetical protein
MKNVGGTKHSIIAPLVPPPPPLFRTHLTDEGCSALARAFVEADGRGEVVGFNVQPDRPLGAFPPHGRDS